MCLGNKNTILVFGAIAGIVASCMLGVFSQTAFSGHKTDEYVACVQACRDTWGYKGNWRDVFNIELQLCYQECNIEYLNKLAANAAELREWVPKICNNPDKAYFQYSPGETIPLTVGRWENPNYPSDWTVDGYFMDETAYYLSEPGDIQHVTFEYASDPTIAWTLIGSTATSEDGFWTVDWVTPWDSGTYFVRATMDSASLGDLEGDLAGHSQVSPSGGVGGIAELPDVSDPSSPPYAAIVALGAAALVALTAGGWYARRRLS